MIDPLPDPAGQSVAARKASNASKLLSNRSRIGVLLIGILAVALLTTGLWKTPLAGLVGSSRSALASANAAEATEAEGATFTASPQANARTLDALQPVFAKGDELLASAAGTRSSADSRLLRIYGLIATSQARQALEEAAKLTEDMPNFGLAQLVYADLLTTLTTPTDEFAAVNQPLRSEANERLRELVAEARARVVAAGHRPPAGSVPSQFVKLDPSVRHAIAVDVSKSRLYVFENTPAGLVLRRDFYSSVGKLGLAKRIEGDLRTPIGVYFGTGRISDTRLRDPSLEDRYGAAAIALNYPNQYDQMKGRTGSGIWLHGVPTSLFSRAPLATDGCVALSNPDMLELTHIVERQETPILIAETIEWVSPQAAVQRRSDFLKTFAAWKDARSSLQRDLLAQFYAAGDGDFGRAERKRVSQAAPSPASIGAVSVVWWQDDREVVVVTYTETSTNQSRARLKRQYWLRDEGNWKVFFEGNLA
ncbi:MAG: L,D-transpeptidase family protein [Ideonella sp.]